MDHTGDNHRNESAHSFDKGYWEEHWDEAHAASRGAGDPEPNPHVVRETSDLTTGTALDAGCGTGAEAVWLATRGWRVVGADVSTQALERAGARAPAASFSGSVTWLEADLTTWEPDGRFDLVMTNYAHPAMPQADFYQRISEWVAVAGTLLIVGHRSHSAGGEPPAKATATVADITASLDPATWRIDSAGDHTRSVAGAGGSATVLQDVVVRATRRR